MLTHCTTADSHTRTHAHTHTYTGIHVNTYKYTHPALWNSFNVDSRTRPHKYTSMSHTRVSYLQGSFPTMVILPAGIIPHNGYLTCMDHSPQWLYYLQGSFPTMVILPAGIAPHNGYITCRDHSPQWISYLQRSFPTMLRLQRIVALFCELHFLHVLEITNELGLTGPHTFVRARHRRSSVNRHL